MTRDGPSKHDALHVSPREKRDELTRGDDPAVRQLAQAAQRLLPDERLEQDTGLGGTGRLGGGPLGHHPEGVGPPLPGGAEQVCRAGGIAQAGTSLGPVGLEQLLLESLELAEHDGAPDRVEERVHHDRALERGGRVQLAALERRCRFVLDVVGRVDLKPVPQPLLEGEERHRGRQPHEALLLGGERIRNQLLRLSEQPGVVRRELAGLHCGLDPRHDSELPGQGEGGGSP